MQRAVRYCTPSTGYSCAWKQASDLIRARWEELKRVKRLARSNLSIELVDDLHFDAT